ncbi:MAG: hypothetical protein ACRCUT_06615, partial [Spirochaetota bacterium]
RYLKMPADIILSKDGMDIVSPSQLKIVKIKNRLGAMKEGIEAHNINAQTLQKMVMNSYIEEISIQQPALLPFRHEIISTNNLVIYAILYKKLTPSISEMIFQSPVVKDFNRKNPRNSIVSLQQINRKSMDELMQKQKDLFDTLKKEIYDEVINRIEENSLLSAEDKKLQSRSLDKFIAWIDLRIWYLYYVICLTGVKDEMKRSFAGMIAVYLKRTQIATHLSNLLMELIQNAEKAHFERLVVRNDLAPPGGADTYLRKRENRESAAAAAMRSSEFLNLSWNMNPERNAFGHQYRINITVSNLGLVDEVTRVKISKKMKADVDGLSIADFYGEAGQPSDKLGAGLGLLYNSYLEDYCHSEGIHYRCNIIPEPKFEKTTVSIDISL